MSIIMTSSAQDYVKQCLSDRPTCVGLRVGVKSSGCSGLGYVLEFADALREDDETFDINGITIVIDGKSLSYVSGTELDFVTEGLNSGFEFKNPNVSSKCGCGESFAV